MWPRKQLDICWGDFAFGGAQVVAAGGSPPDAEIVGPDWFAADEAIVCLSVRTGFDLLLAALRLPPGSEILMSAVTIPDMARIVEHHGLVPVPIDVDAELQPSIAHLRRALSPQSRVILVAHLFGARADMDSVHGFAKAHGLFVIEDCAQNFDGRGYAGHAESDCAMFSFGPIKTATALGGAVLRVRDGELQSRMAGLQRSYPAQNRWSYIKLLIKFATLKWLCRPTVYAALARSWRIAGRDFDRAIGNMAHSFSADDFIGQIRHRPCAALGRMIQRRLKNFEAQNSERLRKRRERGRLLASELPQGVVLGGQNDSNIYWVAAVTVDNPREVIDALRAAGFDATGRSSLTVVGASEGASPATPCCAAWLANSVFLPQGDDMPDAEWARLIAVLRRVAEPRLHSEPEPPPRAVVSLT